jgi:hypothetical protein
MILSKKRLSNFPADSDAVMLEQVPEHHWLMYVEHAHVSLDELSKPIKADACRTQTISNDREQA